METLLISSALIISFILVVISIPPILRVARAKHLFDYNDERKIHKGAIPPLGGIAIFIGFVLSTIVATDGYTFDNLKYIIASVILMFFIGLKDDLLNISAKKKLMVQIFAAVVLVTLGNVRFTSWQGIFGVHELPYFASVIFSIFVLIVIVNSYNLIDGIDGLASGLAILAGGVFGVWFFLAGEIQFAIMSFALVGSLSGFFLFNVFGNTNKLFMGDTGSLVIGLIISTLVIKFNEFNIVKTTPFAIGAAPAVSFAIIIVPLIDTLRVMGIRIMQKRSPFSPDKNHVHHRLLKLTNNHLTSTTIIIIANAFIIGVALLMNNQLKSVNRQFLYLVILGTLLSFIPAIILKIKQQRFEKEKLENEQSLAQSIQ